MGINYGRCRIYVINRMSAPTLPEAVYTLGLPGVASETGPKTIGFLLRDLIYLTIIGTFSK